MKSLFTLLLLALGLIHYGLCAQNVTCISAQNPWHNPILGKNSCNAVGFTVSDPNQETCNIHLNYAEPSDITEVEIQNQPIDYIPRQIFIAFPHVRTFTMSTDLKELQPGDFDNAMNLTKLILAENKIKVIRANVFSNGTQIVRTVADHSSANEEIVFPLHKLTDLRLQQNEISEIEDNSFYGLNNLKIIDLSHNRLKVIRQRTFAGMPALEDLDLRHNKIESIEYGAFNLPNLLRLSFYKNKLKRLSDEIFQNVPQLGWIGLSNNELEYIGQSLYRISKAQRIWLDYNRIQDIDLAAFAKMPILDTLSVSRNGFSLATTQVDDDVNWNSTLTDLNIEYNNLTDAKELRKLRIFPRLKSLALGGNRFLNLEIEGYDTLKDMLPSLKFLYLLNLKNIHCPRMTFIARKFKSKGVECIHDCLE